MEKSIIDKLFYVFFLFFFIFTVSWFKKNNIMTLIKSISGIRGTIGSYPGEGLTPPDIVRFVSAFSTQILSSGNTKNPTVIVGRDARISGSMVSNLVCGTLMGMGINVTDLGMASTPTVEMAVIGESAAGGIVITASHNPEQWNALKLLNSKGEFISSAEGKALLETADKGKFRYAGIAKLGKYKYDNTYNKKHIEAILNLPLVNTKAIRKAGFRIAVDCVNSVGGLIIPELLEELGVAEVIRLYCNPTGRFPHNPEPLPEHLSKLSDTVIKENADLGFAVDPDVDRLAIINEDGTMFGEEYTLVAVADYVLKHKKGNTVSNLSSTQALKDITLKHGGVHTASAVGEVNVVKTMKETGSVIGGEGNGGVIYPELHYGRDALVGIALFLSHLAKSGKTSSGLRSSYPDYYISKNKIKLSSDIEIEQLFGGLKQEYSGFPINETDGIRIEFDNGWVHLRTSNTEPVIRIYSESNNKEAAEDIARLMITRINKLTKQ